jgi:hypothetical protein
MTSSSSAAYRWSSGEIAWQKLIFSLLMPTKNCASACANHAVDRSAQNGENSTVTLDISAGCELSDAFMLLRGHQCGMWLLAEKTM